MTGDQALGVIRMTGDQALRVIRQAQATEGSVDQELLRRAVDAVVETTAQTYSQQSASYTAVREEQPWAWDAYLETRLLELVRERVQDGTLGDSQGRWRLLDVGAGYGRDVRRLARERDIRPVALEISDAFAVELRRLQASGELASDAVMVGDMRDLSSIPDATFDCVRNHATLHHLPIVSDGVGADRAVAETRRILRASGVFYLLVKAGQGVEFIDTGEGLGGRFFQLFTESSLTQLLTRHGFRIVDLEQNTETRPSGTVQWLFALATSDEDRGC